MNAIILAAGIGKRLRPLTTDKPKTLINLDGKTILEYICCNLASVEIRKAYVVLGHAKEKVIEYAKYIEKKLGMRFVFVENRIFEQSNTGYSLLLALERLKETQNDVIIVNGDIIFDFKILLRLMERENTAIVVDNVKKLTKESFKVQTKNGRIVNMGKEIEISQADGEYIGLAKIRRGDVDVFFKVLEKNVRNDINTYYDYAFVGISKYTNVDIVYTNGLKWTEIDFFEDLQYAKEIIREISKGRKCT